MALTLDTSKDPDSITADDVYTALGTRGSTVKTVARRLGFPAPSYHGSKPLRAEIEAFLGDDPGWERRRILRRRNDAAQRRIREILSEDERFERDLSKWRRLSDEELREKREARQQIEWLKELVAAAGIEAVVDAWCGQPRIVLRVLNKKRRDRTVARVRITWDDLAECPNRAPELLREADRRRREAQLALDQFTNFMQ